MIVSAVENAAPAVVSVIVTKDLPVMEQYFTNPFGNDFWGFQIPQYRQKGTEKKEVGGGTGFIISSDGMIVTNKHVVEDEKAEYTVLTNDGKKYPAQVLARDPLNDLAVLKINEKNLPVLKLGDSDKIKIGRTVIAIGNALGEFRNTVSAGIISGLKRSVAASGMASGAEQLQEVIQTDAAINPGNSGGPLLNLAGEVVGVNTAMAQGAENIGFAIPVNQIKKSIESVKKNGKISYPWLGVRYILITEELKKKNNLSVDYGALVSRGEKPEDLAVAPGSPADKAGIIENDIILEVNGVKVNEENTLAALIQKRQIGEEITLKISRKGEEKSVKVKLEERK
ncbi:trypsin-like peptidase domain-containing protein [Candidatus Wolfebacteria bacterium]|nr:trypsin-like peptidase domain-containing protein [Candidatus Wolfebacteria bacterium]